MKFKSTVTAVGLVFPLFISWHLQPVLGRGNVGCFFSPLLCETEETCFDDNAFGHCLGNFDADDDYYRHVLGSDTMRLLEKELSRLFVGGYRWEHQYTQCVVQNILYTKRHGVSYDPGLCARILEMSLPAVPPDVQAKLFSTEPNEMAFIKFTPNSEDDVDDDDDGNSIYAAEYFSPPKVVDQSGKEDGEEDTAFKYGNMKSKYSKRFGHDDRNENTVLRYMLEIDRGIRDLLDENGESIPKEDNEIPLIETDLSSDMNQRPAFSEGGLEWVPVDGHSDDIDEGIPRFAGGNHKRDEDNSKVMKEMAGNDLKTNSVPDSAGSSDQNLGKDGSETPAGFSSRWTKEEKSDDEEDLEYQDLPEFRRRRKYDADNSEYDDAMPVFERSMRYDTKKPGPSFFDSDDDFSEDRKNQMEQRDISKLINLMEEAHDNQLHSVLRPPVRGMESDGTFSEEGDGIAGCCRIHIKSAECGRICPISCDSMNKAEQIKDANVVFQGNFVTSPSDILSFLTVFLEVYYTFKLN